MKTKNDELVWKTVKMPRQRLEQLKKIAYLKHKNTMKFINESLQQVIDDNSELIQNYNELFPDTIK